MTNRLEAIATRQRNSRVRDAIFACLVVIAGAVSITSVNLAAHASQTHVARR